MMILEALRLATGEHAIYFLLTAYVETLHYYDETRSVLPPHVTKLPLTGKADVTARLRVFSQMAKKERHQPAVQFMIEEATEIFAAASRRLSVLAAQAATQHGDLARGVD